MVGPGQEVVLLDHGLVAELDESRKAIFRDFFLGIVFNEGRECAAILEATATSIADNFQRNEFESEIRDLISRTSSRRSDQFQVGSFAVALFDIQRRHGLRGSAEFTMAILSLLTFEGLAKQFHPRLDFQRQAIPFLAAALTRRAGQRQRVIGRRTATPLEDRHVM
jgi:ubiquinone biosynthesis protein